MSNQQDKHVLIRWVRISPSLLVESQFLPVHAGSKTPIVKYYEYISPFLRKATYHVVGAKILKIEVIICYNDKCLEYQ